MTQLTINTAQNVNINFTAASIGTRLLSFCVDLLIQISYLVVVFWILAAGFDVFKRVDDSWSAAAISILVSLPVMFYSLIMESVFEGQSLGKRLLKIKVVKLDGYQAGFGDYLIRWLFRLIDVFTNSGVIGLIAIVASDKSQRLGDMAAGTAVITLKSDITINSTILVELDGQYVPVYPLVIKLSDNDIRIIKETMNLAIKTGNRDIIDKLVSKIESVTGIRNQSGNQGDFIRTILKDYNYYTQRM